MLKLFHKGEIRVQALWAALSHESLKLKLGKDLLGFLCHAGFMNIPWCSENAGAPLRAFSVIAMLVYISKFAQMQAHVTENTELF